MEPEPRIIGRSLSESNQCQPKMMARLHLPVVSSSYEDEQASASASASASGVRGSRWKFADELADELRPNRHGCTELIKIVFIF